MLQRHSPSAKQSLGTSIAGLNITIAYVINIPAVDGKLQFWLEDALGSTRSAGGKTTIQATENVVVVSRGITRSFDPNTYMVIPWSKGTYVSLPAVSRPEVNRAADNSNRKLPNFSLAGVFQSITIIDNQDVGKSVTVDTKLS
jgi:hypothetical protein